MLEAGVLIDKRGHVLYWHAPAGRSSGAIPDSAVLWNRLWRHRDDIAGFAHSHPGGGLPRPSMTDVTTFAAVEAALDRRLVWPIVNRERVSVSCWVGPGELTYLTAINPVEPAWARALRGLSGLLRPNAQKENQHVQLR